MLEIGYYSNGLHNFESVYELPVIWRTYTYKWLADVKKEENDQVEAAQKGNKPPTKDLNIPDHIAPLISSHMQKTKGENLGTIKKQP